MSFFDRLDGVIAASGAAIIRNTSLLVVGLDPNPEMMPNCYHNGNNLVDNLYNWLQYVITETQEQVCAYKPTLGFYEAFGIAGFELLEAVLKVIPASIPVILDAKHGDLNTSSIFARTVFEKYQFDAVTLMPYAGQDHIAPFLMYPGQAVFVTCCTSNPAAAVLQEYPSQENPFYLQIVQEAKNWGTPEQVCLEVGTSSPDTLARIRAIAPERMILARSIWGRSDNLTQILAAGLDKNGGGLLLPVPQHFLGKKNVGKAVKELNNKISFIRREIKKDVSACDYWKPNLCLLEKLPHQDLILQLFDLKCILFGDYIQASGATFSYYIDLRKIISNPQVFEKVLKAYSEILQTLTFDRIAGLPYGALPTATGLSLRLQRPMIFPRKEVKAHGTRRLIEGDFHPEETVVVVDDILISGKSAIEGAEKLESAKLKVKDIVVFLDHEEGVKDRLREKGYNPHSVLGISQVTETLYAAGRINRQEYEILKKSSQSG